MEDRSSRRMRPKWPVRGLSANQLECALISMMARSPTRSNQRPDTLTQDHICQVDQTSCNARPDHTLGSKAPALDVDHAVPVYRHKRTEPRPTSQKLTRMARSKLRTASSGSPATRRTRPLVFHAKNEFGW